MPLKPQRVPLLITAGVLFAAIFALRLAVEDPGAAISVLYVVPVALTALAGSMRGGIAGALVAAALVLLWVVIKDVDLGAMGWTARLVAFFTIGAVVGRYEEVFRDHERRRLGERYASELHDRVIQSLAVARYSLEDEHPARPQVDEALEGAKYIISERLGDVAPGDLRLDGK